MLPNGLLAATFAVLARGDALADAARPLIGLVAALLVAIMAAYASWHLTDRIVGRRGSADHDGL